jgi:poly-gamma-glutamate synthase PgsB/CapB
MIELAVIVLLFVLLLAVTGVEQYRHSRFVKKIPVRIHINGTRGKSSVARLIAAGLRNSGLNVICKTTGSEAKLVLDERREIPILRGTAPNIIEQCKVVEYAANAGADVLVLECMALKPELQAYSELRLVKSTHGVITNCGPDHLDVMGPTELDVAKALAGTVPVNSRLYTNEKKHMPVLNRALKDRQSVLADIPAADTVSDEDMARFSYIEHKENVALALALCADLGVEREVALAGMVDSTPDLGAMDVKTMQSGDSQVALVNAFAANDPSASKLCWLQSLNRHPSHQPVMLVNCRDDRHERSVQLAQMCAELEQQPKVVVIGSGRAGFVKTALSSGLTQSQLLVPEDQSPEALVNVFTEFNAEQLLVVGIGNIKAAATDLLAFFTTATQQQTNNVYPINVNKAVDLPIMLNHLEVANA